MVFFTCQFAVPEIGTGSKVFVVACVDIAGLTSIVRLGGNEFLCVLSDVTPDTARAHFAERIRVGFAALAPEDSAADLIARAGSDFAASADDGP